MSSNTQSKKRLVLKSLAGSLAMAASLTAFAVVHARGGPQTETESLSASTSTFPVIASGLANPHGIAIGDDGTIYIAEAGNGGAGPCVDSYNGGYQDCYGPSGSITRVKNGIQERFVTGLPSVAGPSGDFAAGPARLALHGDDIYLVIGNYGQPQYRAIMAAADYRFGHLLKISQSGEVKPVTNISLYEDLHNPDQETQESNPYALVLNSGNRYLTDAGGNSILKVDANGLISLVATLPTRMVTAPAHMGQPEGTQVPMQGVPASLRRGPDGAFYVAEFTGYPYVKGEARVYRLTENGTLTLHATGFTNIIDIAFDQDGSLYVLEMASNGLPSGDPRGTVIRIAPNGNRTVLASEGLVYPTAIAVGQGGKVYVANQGTSASQGSLIRVR